MAAEPACPDRGDPRRARRDPRLTRRAAGDIGPGLLDLCHPATRDRKGEPEAAMLRPPCCRCRSATCRPASRAEGMDMAGAPRGSKVSDRRRWPCSNPRRRPAPRDARVYPIAGAAPGSTLAAQLLGYVNVDGTGQYGVEGAENAAADRHAGLGRRPGGRHRRGDRRLDHGAPGAGQRGGPAPDHRCGRSSTARGRDVGHLCRRTRRRGSPAW